MWRHYLLGRKFILISNHGGMSYLFDEPKLNVRHERWITLSSEFHFEVKYIKGKENKVENSLSRRLQVAYVEAINTCEVDIRENIKDEMHRDDNFQQVKECLQQELEGGLRKKYSLMEDRMLEI